MKRLSSAIAMGLLTLLALLRTGNITELSIHSVTYATAPAAPSSSSGFCDYFNSSSLNPGWTWVDPLGDSSFSLTANPGHLRLYTPDGGHDLYPYANLDAPRMLQSISGDFVATTKVTMYPSYNYQGAGLLIWQDQDNYIRLERTLVDGVDMWYRIEGVYNGIQIPYTNPTVYLRVQRFGNNFTVWYSANDSDWIQVTTTNYSAMNTLQVGLDLINQWQDNPIWADFDYFELDWCASNPIVTEACLDIGMPYNTNRGCLSPYVGCGGPYHGFYYGVCTDLAIDAYQYGVPFDLAAAVRADYQANPHGYWYGSARNAHDMHTFFEHTEQLLPHTQTYETGDIAFFRWASGNWHVGVTSEIDATGRPTAMVHAPGCQLSCTALEQSWNNYYNTWSQGHGRLSGVGATAQLASNPLQTLVLSVDAPVTMRLYDAQGNVTSDEFDEDLVASNIEAYIPYIPGGQYKAVSSETFITATQPLSNAVDYFVQLTGVSTGDYHLHVQTLQDGSVSASETFTQAITVGETHGITLTLDAPGGVITFNASSPTSAPLMAITPGDVELAGLMSTKAAITVNIAEIGGQQPLSEVSVSVSDVENQIGQEVTRELFTVTPAVFDVPAGGSQSVQLEIDLANIQPGLYQGGLIVAPANRGSQSTPLSLTVRPFRVFLPLPLRNAP
jgi:regulation of enolase protein 1 (concanavalin A-like superfamily)